MPDKYYIGLDNNRESRHIRNAISGGFLFFASMHKNACIENRIILFRFAFPSFREYYHKKLNFTVVSVFLGHNAVYTFEQYNFFQNRTSILLLTVNAMKNVFESVFFLEFSVEISNAIEFLFSIYFFFCVCSILSFFSVEGPRGRGGGGLNLIIYYTYDVFYLRTLKKLNITFTFVSNKDWDK